MERDAAVEARAAAQAERDAAQAERDAAQAERDEAHGGRDAAHAARDEALAERDAALAARDEAWAERDVLRDQIGLLEVEQREVAQRGREREERLEAQVRDAGRAHSELQDQLDEVLAGARSSSELDEQLTAAKARITELEQALEAAEVQSDQGQTVAQSAQDEASMARSLVEAQARELERLRAKVDAAVQEQRAGADQASERLAVDQQLDRARKAVYRYRRRSQHDRARWKAHQAELGQAISGLFAVAHAYPRQLDEMEAVLRQLRVILEGTGKMIDLHRLEAERAYRALFPKDPVPPKVNVER